MKTRAIVYSSPGKVELADAVIPDPTGSEYLVETLLTAVSPGTELRNLSGKQSGITFPSVGGYLNVGRIVGRGPTASKQLADGTLVVHGGTQRVESFGRAYGGHIGHALTGAVFPLPPGLTPRDVILTKLGAIGYKGVRHSSPAAHESVAVVGLGPIGQVSLRMHSLRGCRAIGFDVSPERVALARSAGYEAHVASGSLADARAHHHPAGFDVVSDATGSAAVLPHCIGLFRDRPWEDPLVPGLRLLVQGSYPGDLQIPYLPAFMSEITVHFPRDNHPSDMRAVLELIARGVLKLSDLISATVAPEQAPEMYARLGQPRSPLMTVAFEW